METTYRLLGIIIFLLLSSAASASSDDKDKKKLPTGNANLSPFEQWRSAYECILTEPNPCPTKDKLTMSGELSVSKEEASSDYCQKGGCGEHNLAVLKCIHYVKRDFWFANKAHVEVLQEAISNVCSTSSEINTTNYQKSAANKYMSVSKSLMLALPTVVFMLSFNM